MLLAEEVENEVPEFDSDRDADDTTEESDEPGSSDKLDKTKALPIEDIEGEMVKLDSGEALNEAVEEADELEEVTDA